MTSLAEQELRVGTQEEREYRDALNPIFFCRLPGKAGAESRYIANQMATEQLSTRRALEVSQHTMVGKLMKDSPVVRKACEIAGIPVTRRQVSKFLRGRGLAFFYRFQARHTLDAERQEQEALANG